MALTVSESVIPNLWSLWFASSSWKAFSIKMLRDILHMYKLAYQLADGLMCKSDFVWY